MRREAVRLVVAAGKSGASTGFENLSLDEALARLQAVVATLSRRQAAAFFAVSGEAFFPLYQEFSEKTGWGDLGTLRRAAQAALSFAVGGDDLGPDGAVILAEIAKATPNGDDFAPPNSTFAQDAAICVDAAVRASSPDETLDPAWIEYVLEPAAVMACHDQTGYLDLGNSPEGVRWRESALGDTRLRTAFETSSRILAFLRTKKSIGVSDIDEIRMMAPGLYTTN